MMIWILLHRRVSKLENARQDYENVNVLGYFSSYEKAEAWMNLRKDELGFRDYPDGWQILQTQADQLLTEPLEV